MMSMASNGAVQVLGSQTQPCAEQLRNDSEKDSPMNLITIFGYGSLMNEQSCLRTCKSTTNHRRGILPGWQRVFSLVSLGQIKNGKADMELQQLAAVAVAPVFQKKAPQEVAGALFEIHPDDFDALCKREHRYEVKSLKCFELKDGVRHDSILAKVVIESTDEAYRDKCAKEDQIEKQPVGTRYKEIAGQFYSGRLWDRRDILPVTAYLRLIQNAAYDLGFEENFLDGTFLADRQTSMRKYITRGAPHVLIPRTRIHILPDLEVDTTCHENLSRRIADSNSIDDGNVRTPIQAKTRFEKHSTRETNQVFGFERDKTTEPKQSLRAASTRSIKLRPYIRVVSDTSEETFQSGVATVEEAECVINTAVKNDTHVSKTIYSFAVGIPTGNESLFHRLQTVLDTAKAEWAVVFEDAHPTVDTKVKCSS